MHADHTIYTSSSVACSPIDGTSATVLLLHVGAGVVRPGLNARIVFSRRQKYLVKNETTSVDFLRCEGVYGNASIEKIRVSMSFQSSSYPIVSDHRHTFSCTPKMPNNSGCVHSNEAFCLLGFKSAERRDVGMYDCNAASCNRSISNGQASWHLRMYGELLLRSHG